MIEFIKKDKNFYPEMLLENYKYVVREILSDNSYNDDSNEENSDGTYEENSDEKTLMKKIKYINLFFEKTQ